MIPFLKQPLIHFLVLGGLFFVLFDNINNGEISQNERQINVDREIILDFIQYRAKAFNRELFSKKLDAMSENKLNLLIEEYVREEALAKEAYLLGLDKGDYIIKRRMIQKLEFITQGFSDEIAEINTEELQRYFDENKDIYYVPASMTFTHVFYSKNYRTEVEAMSLANAKLNELKSKNVTFSQGVQHGERFIYHVNYVDRDKEFLTSHFGKGMTDQLFASSDNLNIWLGPYESAYGFHLVMINNISQGYTPQLSAIKSSVYQDALRDRTKALNAKTLLSIINSYTINKTDNIQRHKKDESVD